MCPKASKRIKIRKKWVINPKTRVKGSGKIYSRKKYKKSEDMNTK